MKKIFIQLTEESLIIANTGEPFTAKGVVSVCETNLSAKSNNVHVTESNNIVKSIREEFLEKWTRYPNDYTKFLNDLKNTNADYQHREILELLQNCIDAVSDSSPIGAKGLGFKSIFNISLSPQIYSGNFNFCFDGDKTKECLNSENLEVHKNETVLAMLLPHNIQRTNDIQTIFEQDYCTVIKCPLINDTIHKNIKADLENIAKNPTFLLFVDDIDEIKINIDGSESIIDIQGTKEKFYLYTEKSDNKHISIAIPKDDDAKIPKHNISVYFPTREDIEIKALVHGNFMVSSNRNEVKEKLDNFRDWDDIIKNIVNQIISDSDLPIIKKLEIFKEYRYDFETHYSYDTRIFKEYLHKKIAKYYQDIEFIPTYGGGKASIKECVYWEYNDPLLKQIITDTHPDIKGHNLVCPKTDITKGLLQFYRTSKTYKDIPFYKTISGNVRALTDDIPLLLNLKLPDLFKLNEDYDVLDSPNNIDIEKYKKSFIYDRLPNNDCTKIINNKVSDNFDWDKNGNQIIDFINENKNDNERVKIKNLLNIKVPVKCANTKWQDAHLVYAGVENGGLDIDDILPDNLILSDIGKKDLYENIGISYGFKIIRGLGKKYSKYNYEKNSITEKYKYESEYDTDNNAKYFNYIDKFSEITEHLKLKYSCEQLCSFINSIKFYSYEMFIKHQIQYTPFIKVKGKPILQNESFLPIAKMYLFEYSRYESLFATPDIPVHSKHIGFFEKYEIQTELTSDETEWEKYFEKFRENVEITQEDKYKGFYNTCEKNCDIAPEIDMLCSDGVFRPCEETYYYDTPTLQKKSVISALSNEYPQAVIKGTKRIEFFDVNYLSHEIESEPNIGEKIGTLDIIKDPRIKYYLGKFIESKIKDKKDILEYDVIIVSHIKLSIGAYEIDDDFYINDDENIVYIKQNNEDKIYDIYAQAMDVAYRKDIKCIIDYCLNNRIEDLKYEFSVWEINLDEEDKQGLFDIEKNNNELLESTTQIDSDSAENNISTGDMENVSNIPETDNTVDNNDSQPTYTINSNSTSANTQNTPTQRGAGIPPSTLHTPQHENKPYQPASTNTIPASMGDNKQYKIELPNIENKDSIHSQSRTNAQNSSNISSSESNSENNKRIEKQAIKNATEHYTKLGYTVISVEYDFLGWDLEATKDNEKLQIEVKGRNNYQYKAKLTENEYQKMREYQNKGAYRLFISNRKGIKIFKYDTSKQAWIDQVHKNYLEITEKPRTITEATIKVIAYIE